MTADSHKYRAWQPDHYEEAEGRIYEEIFDGEDGARYAAKEFLKYIEDKDYGSGVDGRTIFVRDLATRKVYPFEVLVEMVPVASIDDVSRSNLPYVTKQIESLKDDADEVEEEEPEEEDDDEGSSLG